jgi:hypothetical protein
VQGNLCGFVIWANSIRKQLRGDIIAAFSICSDLFCLMPEIPTQPMIKFTLYSRTYCHLCEDMLEQLKANLNDTSTIIDVVDVDADEILVAKFDELVPVLFGQKSEQEGEQKTQQICHYFLDVEKTESLLA